LPDAPEYLSDKAKSLWKDIVSCKPPDWFDEGNLPLLGQYCDLVTTAEKLSAQREALPVMHRETVRLRRQHLATVLAATTVAVKLRLTVQNTVDRKSGLLTEAGWGSDSLLRGRDG
jgi:hypothetical protein